MEFKNKQLEEFEKKLKEQKVAVIGLGVSNIPLIEYLHKKQADVTIFDDKEEKEIDKKVISEIKEYNFKYFLGKDSLSKLNGFDIIFRSPSCLPTKPELIKEKDRGAIVTTEIEQLMKMAPCKIIGITGSDGKTTTTTLTYEVLKNAGYTCHLGGNIGIPLFTKLNEIKPEDIIVLELSSFQLMEIDISPNIAAITNVTPNHLNVHKDYQEYCNAKKNIFMNQDENGILVLNADNEITKNCKKESNGKVILFSSEQKLEDGYILDKDGIIKECEDGIRRHVIDSKDLKLKGIHNYQNICTVLALTKTLVKTDDAIETIKEFEGVHHRLELVRNLNQVEWYNDSASTSPTRGISALNAFDKEIILIAGGADKNLDYTPIAKPIVEKVKSLILIGQTAAKIYDAVKEELETQNKQLDIHMCGTFKQSLELAKRIAKPGQVVLFSPASTSFDMFKNMYDRGDRFREEVNKL
ncbi:MAG: UDP-N-acetylmuramoyl-L-alanine--D-glutamate ligase [Clostridia bacterium]|nr:UDP-N-acetylmuramoyl-L-alanine--D-glutamate ligase [Clostridia bacterium]